MVGSGSADPRDGEVAFAGWVSPHLAALMAVAVLEVGSDEAADVVQNTLLRAWRRWDTYAPDRGAPRAWLMAVLIDQARRLRVRRIARFGVAHGTDVPSGRAVRTVDEAPGAPVELRMDLDAAVRALPRRQRQVVVLFYLADMSVADVAAVLGIGTGSVKSHLSDARQTLRKVVDPR